MVVKIKLRMLLLLLAVTAQPVFSFTIAQPASNITIVYEISIKKNKQASGIGETYNGGTKAVFIRGNKARIRLVSLMRIQSIFFNCDAKAATQISIIKESGKNKYRFSLTSAEWKDYNKKFDSLGCDTSFTDSMNIAGYACKKAVITLEDEKKVTVYYTDSIAPVSSFIEPLFRCIPGIVLQYEFSSKKGIVLFKASQVNRQTIASAVFGIPSKGVVVKKYYTDKKASRKEAVITEEEE